MRPLLLKGQKPLDLVGSPRVGTWSVNQKPKTAGINSLEQEKLKGQISYKRMMYRFAPFWNIEHLVTCP